MQYDSQKLSGLLKYVWMSSGGKRGESLVETGTVFGWLEACESAGIIHNIMTSSEVISFR